MGGGGNSAVWCQIYADVPELVEVAHVFEPQAVNREVYDERYRTFLEIHKRMRPLYRRINRGAQ